MTLTEIYFLLAFSSNNVIRLVGLSRLDIPGSTQARVFNGTDNDTLYTLHCQEFIILVFASINKAAGGKFNH